LAVAEMALEPSMFAGQTVTILCLVRLPLQPVAVAVRTTARQIQQVQTVALAVVDHTRQVAQRPRIPAGLAEAEIPRAFLHRKAQTAEQATALLQTLEAAVAVVLLPLEMLDYLPLVALAVTELHLPFLEHQ